MMGKAVLISINPKWCELIASGKKTVEVRKTRPKLETPFKVYIYCTQGREQKALFKALGYKHIPFSSKVVIGEFVCDRIDEYTNYSLDEQSGHIKRREDLLRSACMTLKDWRDYIGSYKSDFGYAWHISNLVIYDNPKELGEFSKPYGTIRKAFESQFITRPPQSWCYVEELR